MKRTWTLMIGLMLLSTTVCTGVEVVGPIGQPTTNIGQFPLLPQMQAADALCTISASLGESAGSLIAPYANWTPAPEPALMTVGVDLTAQRTECVNAICSGVRQSHDAFPSIFDSSGIPLYMCWPVLRSEVYIVP